MTTTTISALEILPTELFHRILDNLDTITIFLSLHQVCQRFNTLLISYNRYELDFSSISRADFDFVCRLFRPENITSLILSDDDKTPGQIGLFLSLVDIRQMTRLRSLTLVQIEECHLFVFLEHVATCTLSSLAIKWRGGFHCNSDIDRILRLLSSAIAQASLHKLDLSLWNYGVNDLSWPVQCTVQRLTIDNCMFNHFCTILHRSPHLRTLVLKSYYMVGTEEIASRTLVSSPYEQLNSLTLEIMDDMKMEIFELFLSRLPSLIYLKLIGSGALTSGAFDGSRWEHFIRIQLPLLNKFEFFFTSWKKVTVNTVNIESLVATFRSKFWLEDKRWFITGDYIKKPSYVRLYSIPICQSHFEYVSESNKISCSTYVTMNNDGDTINRVCTTSVNLSTVMADVMEKRDQPVNNRIFKQTLELTLDIDGEWPNGSLQFLSNLLDLSRLVKLSLNVRFDDDYVLNTMTHIVTLLDRAHNTRSFDSHHCNASVGNIFSIMPRHVKYLQVRVTSVDDVILILEQLEHLSSVTFQYAINTTIDSAEIIDWLKQKKINFTYWENKYSLHIWFAKNTIKR